MMNHVWAAKHIVNESFGKIDELALEQKGRMEMGLALCWSGANLSKQIYEWNKADLRKQLMVSYGFQWVPFQSLVYREH